jgi:hypothetical protein
MEVTISATADLLSSDFIGWVGDDSDDLIENEDGTYSITMDSNKSVTATFNLKKVNLTMAVAGTGSGATNPAVGTYTLAYDYGDTVTISATADASSEFTNWLQNENIDKTTKANTKVTMNGDQTVTASFIIKTYNITASAGANGSISPSGEVTVNHGSDQIFTITPDTNYHIVDVLVDRKSKGAVSSYTFTDVTKDHTISATFNVTVGPANKLLWITQPASPVVAGATWETFTIEITDQYGNRTSDTDNITITASGTGTLGGTLTQAAVDGLATFNNITYDKAETITITGSYGTLTPTPASSSVSVTVGPANKLLWVTQPASPVVAGATWETFTIEITDEYGNRTSGTDEITIAAFGTGILGGTLTQVAVDGLATFDNITYDTVETIIITGSDKKLTDTPASSSVSVTVGTKDKLLWITQPASPVVAGATWETFTIEITDEFGNRTSDADNITIAALGGTETLGGDLTQAAVNGVATFDNITYDTVETITITGSATGLTPTPASSSVSVTAGDLDHFDFATISSPQTAGTAFAITITAKDAANNTVTSYTGRNTLSYSTGTISPNRINFSNGVWTDDVTITTAEKEVSITTVGDGKTGTSNNFDVTAGTLDHFEFASISTPQTAGTPFTITIYAKDVYENTVTGYTGTGTLTDSTKTISPNSINFSNGVWTGKVTITVAQNNVVITINGNGSTGECTKFRVQS